jgi:hypothetical protein
MTPNHCFQQRKTPLAFRAAEAGRLGRTKRPGELKIKGIVSNVETSDVEKAEAFYHDILGLRLVIVPHRSPGASMSSTGHHPDDLNEIRHGVRLTGSGGGLDLKQTEGQVLQCNIRLI